LTGSPTSSSPSGPRFRWLMPTGLLILAIVLALAVVEVAARVFFSDGTNFDVEMWRYAKDLKRVSDLPGVGHEHIPDSGGRYMGVDLKINAHKLRDLPYDFAKPAGVTRILMLGDSLTLGWGAPFEETTPKMLERRLDGGQPSGRYQVINTGVGNYNTAMEVAYFLGEGYRYNPDIVVLNYFINDAEPTPSRKQNYLLEHSYAAVVTAGAWDTIERMMGWRPDWKDYYSGLYAPHADGWRGAQHAIAQLAAYCHDHGMGLLIADLPELHEVADYPFKRQTDQLAAVATANGVPFVDLLPTVADVKDVRTLWVTPTDAHPNGRAAERYAARLEQVLRATFPNRF
jgi:lysophospholipase L1-like esterase